MQKHVSGRRILKADGVEITLTSERGYARVVIKTAYVMEQALRWDFMLILKEATLRSKTRPQIGPKGGFCTHIDPSRAMQTASQILRRARRDQIFALQEEIRLPKSYVR